MTVPMVNAQRTHPAMSLLNPSGANTLDIVQGRLYDSILYGGGATITEYNSRLFSNVGVASGKTLAHTNMHRSCQLPPPEALLIERVLIQFPSSCAPEVTRHFIETAVFEFFLGSKLYFRAPLITLPRRGNYEQKAPLKCCESCGSCFVGLKCESCEAPEWRYLSHAGSPVGDEEEVDEMGISLVLDVKETRLVLSYGWNFYGGFNMGGVGMTIAIGRQFKVVVSLEGWHARGVQ